MSNGRVVASGGWEQDGGIDLVEQDFEGFEAFINTT